MIDKGSSISIRKQCKLLNLSRNVFYYTKKEESQENLALMLKIDKVHTKDPCSGTRRIKKYLLREEHIRVSRSRISRLMKKMCIEAIYQRPRTTKRNYKEGVNPGNPN